MKYNQLEIKKNSFNFRDDLFKIFYIDDVCDSSSSFFVKIFTKLIVLNRHYFKAKINWSIKKRAINSSCVLIFIIDLIFDNFIFIFIMHFLMIILISLWFDWFFISFFSELFSSLWLISNLNSFIFLLRLFVLRYLF